MLQLWEILVPQRYNNGKLIMLSIHKEWDKKVADITGELTILHSIKGSWRYNDEDYVEEMIPVRIACTKKQLNKVIELTLNHYNQKSVMVYKISNEVVILTNYLY